MKIRKNVIRKVIDDRLLQLKIQHESAVWVVGFIEEIGARLLIDRLDLGHARAFNPEIALVYVRIDTVLERTRSWVKESKKAYERMLEISHMQNKAIVALIEKQGGRI